MLSEGLIQTVILLGAAVLIVPVFQFLRLGSVLGFLAAGMVVGPGGMGLITELEQIRSLAELGVVFLLFIIGIELKPARLWLMRRQVFGMGSVQVVATGLVLTIVLVVAGLQIPVAVLLGLGLALSSTAFVLQILTERQELGSVQGRAAFAILLLQDLAVVPLLAMVPMLASPESSHGGELGLVIAESLGSVVLVILIGRYLLRPVLHQVALYGSQEIFLATGLLLVLGTAVLIEHAGMSMAMGAFLAGLLIADSEFRHQIMADIMPFRAILLGLFFMSVGMVVDPAVMIAAPGRIVMLLLMLLAIKAAVLWVVARIFGITGTASRRLALLLAQSGEFGFVLFGVAQNSGLLEYQLYQEAILVVALSMVATPLLAARLPQRKETVISGEAEEVDSSLRVMELEEKPKVIIAGFGRMGQRIASLLHDAGVSYIAIEMRPKLVETGRNKGFAVFYGNAMQQEVLESAGVADARLMVVAVDNPDVVERLVAEIHRLHPKLPIFARGHSHSRCMQLLAIGASGVASENLEASLQLARSALRATGVDEAQAELLLDEYRSRYYSSLQHPEQAQEKP